MTVKPIVRRPQEDAAGAGDAEAGAAAAALASPASLSSPDSPAAPLSTASAASLAAPAPAAGPPAIGFGSAIGSGHRPSSEPDDAWRRLHEDACAPYRHVSRWAWHWARGKLGRDPVFRGLLEHGYLPPHARVVDIGCGQGLLASLLIATRRAAAEGRWPAAWPAAPSAAAYTGIELMARDTARAAAALSRTDPAPRPARPVAAGKAGLDLPGEALLQRVPAARTLQPVDAPPSQHPPTTKPGGARETSDVSDVSDVSDAAETAVAVFTADTAPPPRFVTADMRQAALPACDVVVILDVLHYVDEAAQQALLERVAVALAPGGRLLLRVGDTADDRGYRASKWVDAIVTRVRGHRAAPTWGRPLAAWQALLQRLGFTVQAVPMSRGTPFANVLLVADLPAAHAGSHPPAPFEKPGPALLQPAHRGPDRPPAPLATTDRHR